MLEITTVPKSFHAGILATGTVRGMPSPHRERRKKARSSGEQHEMTTRIEPRLAWSLGAVEDAGDVASAAVTTSRTPMRQAET